MQKYMLSASVDGRPTLVVQAATPGTLIHAAPAGILTQDEPWMWACNGHSADVELTVEWGAGGAGDIAKVTLAPKKGWVPIEPGIGLIRNGLEVRAFASVASVVSIKGWAIRAATPA